MFKFGYQYQPQTGRFRDSATGRFVKLSVVESALDTEVESLKNKLGAIALRLADEKIDIPTFQTEMAIAIKDSHIRLGAIASGGHRRMTNKSFGAIGGRLSDEFVRYLYKFGQDIAQNDYSKEYLVMRSQMYARSAKQSFHAVRHQTRISDGARKAKRTLSDAHHCPQCPLHQTFGQWVDARLVKPVGADCQCRANCKCRVEYL